MEESQNNDAMLIKKALAKIYDLKEKLNEKEVKEPIAILGASCRFPGEVTNPEEYWRMLIENKEGLQTPPIERWNHEKFYDPALGTPNSIYLKQASFIQQSVKKFDARFFGISPREAEEIDPQHRFLLELSWEALECSGIVPESIKEKNVGIFIGIIGSEYSTLVRKNYIFSPYLVTGIMPSMASGRIAYFYGTHGPAISTDTACSSSLVTFHQACRSLQSRECDIALVGGINLLLNPDAFVSLCQLRALSKDGRCKSFDIHADGYGRGEGGGFIVLKRLDDAIVSRDAILAVVKGSAVNHDGKSKGLTIPNHVAQVDVIRKALLDAQIGPDEVSFIEAHGTGTGVGDPIEIQAIEAVFKDRKDRSLLPISSVKANIGHCEAASGIASILKAVLCLKHQMIPAQLNFKELNPNINLNQIPAYIPLKNEDWSIQGKPRIVGVNSFGFSGTNAHIILQEWIQQVDEGQTPSFFKETPYFLPISAKTEEALKNYVKRYKNFLSNFAHEFPLHQVQNAMCLHRTHFNYRLIIQGNSIEQLLEQLTQVDQGNFSLNRVQEAKHSYLIRFNGKYESKETIISYYYAYESYRLAFDQCWNAFGRYSDLSVQDLFYGKHDSRMIKCALTLCSDYAFTKMIVAFGLTNPLLFGLGIGFLSACVCGNALDFARAADLIHILVEEDPVRLQTQMTIHESLFAMVDPMTLSLIDFPYTCSLDMLQKNINQGLYENLLYHFPSDFVILSSSDQRSFDSVPNFSCIEIKSIMMKAYTCGYHLKWDAILPNTSLKHIALPTYPFEYQYYWFTEGEGETLSEQLDPAFNALPLKGQTLASPLNIYQHQFQISESTFLEAKDTHGLLHVGQIMEMIYSIAHASWKLGKNNLCLSEFALNRALFVNGFLKIHAVMTPIDAESASIALYTRTNDIENWNDHVTGKLLKKTTPENLRLFDHLKEYFNFNSQSSISRTEFYSFLSLRGVELGPSVRWVENAYLTSSDTIVALLLGENGNKSFSKSVFDAIAQLFHLFLSSEESSTKVMLISWENAHILNEEAQGPFYVVIKQQQSASCDILIGDVCLFDVNHNPCFYTDKLGMKKLFLNDQNLVLNEQNDLIKKIFTSIDLETKKQLIIELIKIVIGKLLKINPLNIESRETLYDLGLDSIVSLDFRNQLQTALKIEIDLELLFSHLSIQQLGENLNEKMSDKSSCSMQQIPINKSWLKGCLNDEITPRLYCFPYGAGGASEYLSWEKMFNNRFRVIPIQLPGREERASENPIGNIHQLVSALRGEIKDHLSVPYAFYGHSIGALVAYALCFDLQEMGMPLPRHLFVGAFSSPTILPNPWFRHLSHQLNQIGISSIPLIDTPLSDAKLNDIFKVFNSGEFTEFDQLDESYFQKLLPSIWADLHIVNQFKLSANPQLKIPITALGGLNDERVSNQEIQAWKELTSESFSSFFLEGDHFFLRKHSKQAEVIEIINQTMFK